MLPGKKYMPEDYLAILQRRLWWVLVPCALATAGAALLGSRMPNLYLSETSIMVIPQRVPDTYVRSTVTAPVEARLEAIKPVILARPRLEQIVQQFNLYAPQRANGMLMEDVVQRMRSEIVVTPPIGDTFKIQYTGPEPLVVKGVVDELAKLFIDENLRDRTNLAESTNQFLEAQLIDAKRKLQDTEQRLAAYRGQFAGELPEQLEANLTMVQNAHQQKQQLSESLDGDQDRRILLEQQLNDLQGVRPDAPGADAQGAAAAALASSSTAQQLAQARANLEAAAQRWRPGHPDLERARRVVTDLEAKLDEEARAPQSQSLRTASPAELERRRRIGDLQNQIREIDLQVTRKRADIAKLDQNLVEFQKRVDAAPKRESELIELRRDYGILQAQYSGLLQKKEDSRIAANLESRQIGEQFRLLEPARQAERPFSPNRGRINLIGAVLGLIIGFGFVGFFEYRDTTLKSDEDVTAALGLPVVAVVPLMESDADHRQALRRRIMISVGLGGTVAACAAVVVYTLVR